MSINTCIGVGTVTIQDHQGKYEAEIALACTNSKGKNADPGIIGTTENDPGLVMFADRINARSLHVRAKFKDYGIAYNKGRKHPCSL